jgi:hypothetical protein
MLRQARGFAASHAQAAASSSVVDQHRCIYIVVDFVGASPVHGLSKLFDTCQLRQHTRRSALRVILHAVSTPCAGVVPVLGVPTTVAGLHRICHRVFRRQTPPSRSTGAIEAHFLCNVAIVAATPGTSMCHHAYLFTSSSTTSLPASSSRPRLLRLLRSDNRVLRRHSRRAAPQPSRRPSLLVP